MTDIYTIFSVIQSLAVALGIGCSTVVIIHYLISKHDGHYEPTKELYGRIVTTLLRIALALIIISTMGTATVFFLATSTILLTTYTLATWTFILILIFHTILIMRRLMPGTIGPSLQTTTWYAFGTAVALPSSIMQNTSYAEFLIWYFGTIGVVVILINLIIAHQKGQL